MGIAMKYLVIIFEFLFGCHHEHLSRVFTINRHSYKVCCDCGAEFQYSLEKMSICGRVEHDSLASVQSNPYPRTA